MTQRCFAVIPAAGLSRRMGQPKLLLDIAGQTVIARLLTALHAAEVDHVMVVGRRNDVALWREVEPQVATIVRPDIDPPDMRASIEHALSAIREQFNPTVNDGWLLSPADHPVLDANVIREVIAIWRSNSSQIVIPTHAGERGHPTVLPWSVADEVFQMPRDRGLNWLIRSRPDRVLEWPVSNPAVLVDLDTPEDLARLRQRLLSSTNVRSVTGSSSRGIVPSCSQLFFPTGHKWQDQAAGVGGVIVCGGKSTRMGRPKLSLPFGEEVMLQRVCRILKQVVEPIVVVAADQQDVPKLPDNILVIRDEFPDQGPLAGIATGLGALQGVVPAAYVTSCDVPLLKPEFIQDLIKRMTSHNAVVPFDGEFDHVLAAVYRTNLHVVARQLLAAQRRRPLFLIEQCDALRVPTSDLLAVDPKLDSLRNLNTPEDYAQALQCLRSEVEV